MTENASQASFKALVADQVDGKLRVGLTRWTDADLPEAEVTVAVAWSSFNYKDGLALTGKGRILRKFPMVPGIDFAGTVIRSDSPDCKPGDAVVLTGWGVGESWSGGFAERARVKPEWLVPLPDGMTARHAMAVGTAGFTAMLAVMALERHGLDRNREILVTGAAGGVGSVAVRLLAANGYTVAASTGRPEQADYLKSLGASVIVDRNELAQPSKPLTSERWGGAVDTVGGTTLASVLAGVAYGGAAAACGLAGGADLPTTVMPFILRGVSLLGIDSVNCPKPRRQEAWTRIARELPPETLDAVTTEVALEDLPRLAEDILKGQVRGRTVVRVGG
ncbi:oxidoreductase [Skermanella mucosa]|uniref:acrylyl-CoA reductase (NADPH) n=1 Tax=Skermanella mucosa TaxID=1789672 RepID=UPI00192A89CC|nr:MDR family oxidoreductase [Skermanella mucosa]UEM20891.1 oxidoreductase [Skermanella mucosa]